MPTTPTVIDKKVLEPALFNELVHVFMPAMPYPWVELNKLRAEATNALMLTARVTAVVGTKINVGETFKVDFTLWLGAVPNHQNELRGRPAYRNVAFTVRPTEFATLVDGPIEHVMLTPMLTPGMTPVHKVVTFKALRAIPLPTPLEVIAHTTLEADFDIAAFFHIVQNQTFEAQILET